VQHSQSQRLHELFMELVRVAGLLQPDHQLPGFSVSMSQAFALHELDAGAPLSQQDLAERLLLEKSTISRMVADLQDKGLVTRERDSANRRTYRLLLTDKGRDFHARMSTGYGAQYHEWTAAMTAAERDALLVGLPALIRAVRRHETSRGDGAYAH
jgi:DNA-binding MarR family transcriptional regulator